MKLKKIIALVVAGVLALGLTGCMGHFYDDAGKVNGVEISSGLYLMAEYMAYSEANNLREDTEKSVFSQKVEGKSANDWITARTEELLRWYVCVRDLAREKGLAVTSGSTAESNINQMMQYWAYMEESFAERGIAQETYLRWLTTQELSGMLFLALYDTGGELAVPDEELKAAYAEQYAYYQAFSIPLTSGADGVDMRDEVVAEAQKLVEKLEGGATLAEVAENDLVPVYDLLMREFDPTTAADSIYPSYTKYDQPDSATYSQEDLDALRAAPEHSFGLLVTNSTVVVYEKLPMFEDDAEFEAKRQTVLSDLMTDDYEEYLRAIYNEYEVSWAFGAQWYLSPKKAANE